MLADPVNKTRCWIETVVIGLNLCPFAASVIKANTAEITVCDEKEEPRLLEAVLKQLDTIHHTDEQILSTSLLIFTHALADFDEYLALLDAANDLLIEVGLESVVQIASFHPHYYFDGVDKDDVTNYSNRSPYPMLHFLRESQVSEAVDSYPNSEKIPENNINRLRTLGKSALLALINNDR